MGGLLAFLALHVKAALKRTAVVYGLMAAGALIFIFASGYALNAAYTALMFRCGPIAASLTIAGGPLAVAIACVITARDQQAASANVGHPPPCSRPSRHSAA